MCFLPLLYARKVSLSVEKTFSSLTILILALSLSCPALDGCILLILDQ